ncbi:hypothetical protein ACFL47_00085 [Candidatus Latescibacterota bacterium]
MKRFPLIVSSALIVLFCTMVSAKEFPDWEGYPPMFTIQDMIEYNGYIYCACKGGLYRYNPVTKEYTLYFKNHGLLSNNVLALAQVSDMFYLGFETVGLVSFDPETEEYEQILFPEYVTKNKDPMAVRKIFAKNDSILYIGHSDGVDRLNLTTKELRTFTNLGHEIPENSQINDVKVFKDKIWVCTDFGLAVADEDNPDLEVESSWKNYNYSGNRFNCIELVEDRWETKIFIGTMADGIILLNEERDKLEPTAVARGSVYDFHMGLGIYWAAADHGLYKKFSALWSFQESDFTNLRAFAGSDTANIWVGTKSDGLQYYTPGRYQPIPPVDGPRNSAFYSLDTDGNVLWTSTANRDNIMDAHILRLEDGVFTEYGDDFGLKRYTVDAVMDDNGYVWLPHWAKGLFVMKDDGTPGKENDVIEKVDPDGTFIKPTITSAFFVCADVEKDSNGNIWIVNHQVKESNSGVVVVDGYPVTRHQTYSPDEDGLVTAEITGINVDDDGWVWLVTPLRGMTALYVGDDPYDKSDTFVRGFTLGDGLHSMTVTAIQHDLNGDIWVGSKGGLNRIKKLSGNRFRVDDVNNLIGSNSIEITCIEVDSENNKWIGTNGAGLLRLDDQNNLVADYTQENSGVFSNIILSMKFDTANDALWVGTDTGLNRFFLTGSETEEHDTDIHVYPNPFEIWGTNTTATFANLKQQSPVRIYTFGGELVNELVAGDSVGDSGASVMWNGWNYKGRVVSSGVYFFIGTDSNGNQFKDKMVVIRR